MPHDPEAIVRRPERRTAAWTAVALMAGLVGFWGLFALYAAHHHEWTDRLIAGLPWPGPATSLAADPTLAAQLRISEASARMTTLSDRTPALVAEARVTNDALIPVRKVVVEAVVRAGGRERSVATRCGKTVSDRLLRRMPRSEVTALMRLVPVDAQELASGESTRCQVAIAGVEGEVDAVEVRVASAEPLPGHPRPRFLSPE